MAKEFVKDREIRCRGAARGCRTAAALQLQSGPVGRTGLAPVYSAEMFTNRPAFASLAEAYVTEGFVGNSEYWFGVQSDLTPSTRSKVEALLAQALAIDPDSADAYLVRGWLNQFEPSAEADFRRGLALSPNNAAGM